MPMIGGEMAELSARAGGVMDPALRRRIDEVFAVLFAGRPPLPDAGDADDRMRVTPSSPERLVPVGAVPLPEPGWEREREPGEVPALAVR
jgi:hypothetical protein